MDKTKRPARLIPTIKEVTLAQAEELSALEPHQWLIFETKTEFSVGVIHKIKRCIFSKNKLITFGFKNLTSSISTTVSTKDITRIYHIDFEDPDGKKK